MLVKVEVVRIDARAVDVFPSCLGGGAGRGGEGRGG
jgi:hypothetical protein